MPFGSDPPFLRRQWYAPYDQELLCSAWCLPYDQELLCGA
jgi:hypothetical protein